MKEKDRKKKPLHSISIFILAIALLISGFVMLGEHYIQLKKQSVMDNAACSSASAETVLYLSSDDAGYPAFDEVKNSVVNTLYKEGYDCDVMCMDAKAFNSLADLQSFHDMLKQRLSETSYVGVLVSDDIGLQFVMQYQEELFPSLPITYFGVSEKDVAEEASLNPSVSGFLENACINETIDLARKLLPEADHVVGIYDKTPSGLGRYEAFLTAEKDYPSLTFSTLSFSEHTAQETEEIVSSYGEDVILLNLSSSRDADNNYYMNDQSAALLYQSASIPIFSCAEGGYETGYAAGACSDFSAVAQKAAEQMVHILQGKENAEDINTPAKTDDEITITGNEQIMKQFNLDISALPEDTVWVQTSDSFWQQYHTVLIPSALIALGMGLLSVYLHQLYARSRQREAALEKAVHDARIARSDLQWHVEHDFLTGLMDWRTLLRKINDSALEKKESYAIILADIQNFKSINETFGHNAGDILLVMITEKLKQAAPEPACLLSRYGGDEFMIVVRGRLLRENDPFLLKITSLFNEPVQIGQDTIVPSAVLGYANSDGTLSPEQVILNADVALNHAKHSHRKAAIFYSSELKQELSREVSVRAAIHDALLHDGFRMVYQPQVDTFSGKTTGYEALVRMPSAGISPGIFIPVAETSGLIRQIGRITAEKTIAQIALWKAQGEELHPVSINFSSVQIGDTCFPDFLKKTMEKYDVDPSLVELEITERFAMDGSREAKGMLKAFASLGIRLLLDDFGTGYSSLGSLKNIPVSIVKIDKSFVDNYLVDGEDCFVKDVITLVHDLGRTVIVEGVESREQYERLKAFGADAIQGYYFSKPLNPDDIPSFKAVLPE